MGDFAREVWLRLEDTFGEPGVIDGKWRDYRGHPQALVERVLEAADHQGAVGRAEKAEALLRRLYEWDHMQTAGDGPYWKGEIDSLLGER